MIQQCGFVFADVSVKESILLRQVILSQLTERNHNLQRDASKLPWGQIGVDVVLGVYRFHTSKEKLPVILTAGAKKVVISALQEMILQSFTA